MKKNIEEIIRKAEEKSRQYIHLSKLIDWESIKRQLSKDISLYSFASKEKPLNIIESLLRPFYDNNSVFDHKINLAILDKSLEILLPTLSYEEKANFSSKISNLSNTAFWDTTPEIWLAAQLKNKDQKIKIDFPLEESQKGHTAANADIAILDDKNNLIWLIDSTSPVLDNKKDSDLIIDFDDQEMFFNSDPRKATNWLVNKIAKKYNNKFATYVDNFPDTKLAIFLVVTKSDIISLHFDNIKLPIILDDIRLRNCRNLYYAVVGRFENNHGILSFIKLIEYRLV